MRYSEEQLAEMAALYHEQLEEAPISGYICPVCGNGSGDHGTGMIAKERSTRWKYRCYSPTCERKVKWLDCFDLEGLVHKTDDFIEKVEYVKAKVGLSGYTPETYEPSGRIKKPNPIPDEPVRTRKDYTGFFRSCNDFLNNNYDYLRNRNWLRGLSLSTLNHFKVGYHLWHYTNPKTGEKSSMFTPKMIIPVRKYCYMARDMRSESEIRAFTARSKNPEQTFQKIMTYSKQKTGGSELYNIFTPKSVRKPSGSVWIVEGEIDTMSLYEADPEHYAIGLGSVNNAQKLLQLVSRNLDFYRQYRFLVALDNDKAGWETGLELTNELQALGIEAVYLENLWNDCNDPNEVLMKHGREYLKSILDRRTNEAAV